MLIKYCLLALIRIGLQHVNFINIALDGTRNIDLLQIKMAFQCGVDLLPTMMKYINY